MGIATGETHRQDLTLVRSISSGAGKPVASLQGMMLECYTACGKERRVRDAQKGT